MPGLKCDRVRLFTECVLNCFAYPHTTQASLATTCAFGEKIESHCLSARLCPPHTWGMFMVASSSFLAMSATFASCFFMFSSAACCVAEMLATCASRSDALVCVWCMSVMFGFVTVLAW